MTAFPVQSLHYSYAKLAVCSVLVAATSLGLTIHEGWPGLNPDKLSMLARWLALITGGSAIMQKLGTCCFLCGGRCDIARTHYPWRLAMLSDWLTTNKVYFQAFTHLSTNLVR